MDKLGLLITSGLSDSSKGGGIILIGEMDINLSRYYRLDFILPLCFIMTL